MRTATHLQFHHPSRSQSRGMVLVITLALVVVLTIAVMAFFSHATSNRQVEASRTNQVRSNVLARSATDYIIGLLLQEITDPSCSSSDSSSGVSVYFPISNTNAIPRRMLASGITVTDSKYFNLIRQSAPTADANASTHGSYQAAMNGRTVRTNQWNLPTLITGNGFNADTQCPNWVYMNRVGGVTNSPSTNAFGRFAYNIYDIGGLLDANAAGYPGALSATDISKIKGTLAGADLTQLSSSISQGNVDALLTFRHLSAATSASAFKNAVTAFSQTGYRTPMATNQTTAQVFTNNAFIGRQDLLRYVRTQNPSLTSALPYLTHFSRSVNAPSWVPTYNPSSFGSTNLSATINYKDNSLVTTASPFSTSSPNPNPAWVKVRSSGANIIHYSDDGTIEPYDSTTTAYSYSTTAGDPVLQRRFSLAKLAWLTPTGPATGISSAAIQSCFGLQWDGSNARWNYVGNSGSTVQSSIKTLSQIAAENREPNFFEYLKAGILSGSLGQGAQKTTLANANNQGTSASPGPERNKDLQLIRIGASIIDCSDADNFPTIIAFLHGTSTVEQAGVEDLPYFHSMWMTLFQTWDSPTSPTKYTKADLVWIPTLINPHRASSPTSGPSDLSIDFADGVLTKVTDNNGGLNQSLTKSLAALGSIAVPSTAFEGFRTGPQPVRNSGSANRIGNLVSYVTGDSLDAIGYLLFSYENEYKSTWPAVPSTGAHSGTGQQCLSYMQNVVLRLQYRTPGGILKTYATLSGNEGLSIVSGMYRGGSVGALYCNGFTAGDKTTLSAASPGGTRAVLWDPRTNRLGPSLSGWNATLTDIPPIGSPITKDRVVNDAPFAWSEDKNADPIFTGMWPQGGKASAISGTNGKYTNLEEADGVFRPADAWLGTAANPYYTSAGSLDINHIGRPVILQRPFQSVAELGYVFRDNPWKTLNLFDERSADAALLDLFSVTDEPAVVAGKINLNSRQPLVQQALLSGVGCASDGTSPLTSVSNIATAFQSYSFTSGAPTTSLSGNVAQIATFLNSTPLTSALPATTESVKYRREAVARALAGCSQTRTWNLLIDVVAQNGRFVQGTAASNFSVDGERHYWVSVAIDRYTGKIVDQQWETINE